MLIQLTETKQQELGLKIEKATDGVDKTMRELYDTYADEMRLGQPFHQMNCLPEKI